MIFDALELFSSSQSITTGSGSGSAPGVRSTNILDLGQERRIGTGENIYLVVLCTLAMTSSGSNDALDVNLYSDTDSAFGSPTLMQKVGTFPAVSAAGTRIVCRLNPEVLNERYIGLYFLSQTTDPLTQGSFTAFLTHDIDASDSYADNIKIS